jgi:cell division protein FtsW
MMIALEAFINIAGVMGLIPLKGLALPFLSYGGTSLLMSLIAIGILLNISSYEG